MSNTLELARLRTDLDILRENFEQQGRALAATDRAREMAEADAAALSSGFLAVFTAQTIERRRELKLLAQTTHPGAQLLAELEAARAVVAAARAGFGTEEDIRRAWAFDPNLLTARIRAYDAAVKASER